MRAMVRTAVYLLTAWTILGGMVWLSDPGRPWHLVVVGAVALAATLVWTAAPDPVQGAYWGWRLGAWAVTIAVLAALRLSLWRPGEEARPLGAIARELLLPLVGVGAIACALGVALGRALKARRVRC